MIVTIGKATDNDIVVDEPHVSRHHARLTRDSEGNLILEDIGSTNGTYVNGSQIVRKKVSLLDEVKLGDVYTLQIHEVLNASGDYQAEFDKLKEVYQNYIEKKIRIQSANQFKTRLFQSLPFALIGVTGVILGFAGKSNSTLLLISLFVAICAPTIGIYLGAKQAAKTPQLLQDLINQFKINYVCPKCGTFLGEIPWESLRNKKECPVSSCKAKWVSN